MGDNSCIAMHSISLQDQTWSYSEIRTFFQLSTVTGQVSIENDMLK